MRWALVVGLGLMGCATARSHFVTDAELDVDVSRFGPVDAVVLLQRERTTLDREPGRLWTQSSHHEVLKVLKPGVAFTAVVPDLDLTSPLSFAARIACPGAAEQRFDERALTPVKDTSARKFVFPPAAPGCALEYAWEFTAPGALPWNRSDGPGRYPIARSELELTLPPGARVEVGAYHGAKLSRDQGNDGTAVVHVVSRDVPAFSTEDNAPDWTFTTPWWQWRVLSLVVPGRTVDMVRVLATRVPYLRTWDDLGTQFARRFSSNEVTDGFKVTLDSAGCADARCLAQRAVDLVQQHTRRAANPQRVDNLAKAWASGEASQVERALMVKRLLDPLLPDVSLAFGSARLSRWPTPDFPAADAFDQLFVSVGASPKASTPFLIDPTCEGCAVGVVPAPYVGSPFFVFDNRGRSAFTELPATAALEASRTHHAVVIDANGTLVDQLSLENAGAAAADDFRDHARSTPTELRAHFQRFVSDAEVREARVEACTPGRCAWAATVNFGPAPCEPGRWRVPLRFLRAERTRWMLPIERDADVHLRDAERFEEVADIAAPPGFVLETVPPATRVTIGGFTLEVVSERTIDGARVTRRLAHGVEVISRDDYARLHEALRVFRDARALELVFTAKQ